jgi:hypothetical protein
VELEIRRRLGRTPAFGGKGIGRPYGTAEGQSDKEDYVELDLGHVGLLDLDSGPCSRHGFSRYEAPVAVAAHRLTGMSFFDVATIPRIRLSRCPRSLLPCGGNATSTEITELSLAERLPGLSGATVGRHPYADTDNLKKQVAAKNCRPTILATPVLACEQLS